MDKLVAETELVSDVGHILDEVELAHVPFVITRNDRPAIVMMAYAEYQKFISREQVWAQFSQSWAERGKKNAQYSEEEIEADVELAIQEVRAARKQ